MKGAVFLLCVMMGLPAWAGPFSFDVVVLGELHDNPHHHARQAQIVAEVQPKALVFEMLTEAQAANHVPGGDLSTLSAAFDWDSTGWPDFAMYHPIFAAAPTARVFGAGIPRTVARQVMSDGLDIAFGTDAETYGLTTPLDSDEQATREALQMAAHCDALPEHILPAIVDIQRLRDAQLAKMVARAFELTGGPVVVITGNGHARTDWGMPIYLKRAAPDLSLVALGQGEEDIPPLGTFDRVEFTQGVDRSDPCAAFATTN